MLTRLTDFLASANRRGTTGDGEMRLGGKSSVFCKVSVNSSTRTITQHMSPCGVGEGARSGGHNLSCAEVKSRRRDGEKWADIDTKDSVFGTAIKTG